MITSNCSELHTTFDASVWAERFVEKVKEHPDLPMDEGAMLGWFANALVAGYDYAKRGGVA